MILCNVNEIIYIITRFSVLITVTSCNWLEYQKNAFLKRLVRKHFNLLSLINLFLYQHLLHVTVFWCAETSLFFSHCHIWHVQPNSWGTRIYLENRSSLVGKIVFLFLIGQCWAREMRIYIFWGGEPSILGST